MNEQKRAVLSDATTPKFKSESSVVNDPLFTMTVREMIIIGCFCSCKLIRAVLLYYVRGNVYHIVSQITMITYSVLIIDAAEIY